MNKATRRRYTAEFKAEAVALVQDQGYKIADAARALGIDRKLLDRWMAKAREQPQPSAAADSRKCPAKYILPLPRRNSDDAFQSGKRGAASWDGDSAVVTNGSGWWRVVGVAG
jgi:transposase-like protein